MATPEKQAPKAAEGKQVRVRRHHRRGILETEVTVGKVTAGDDPVLVDQALADEALAARDEDGRPYLELVE